MCVCGSSVNVMCLWLFRGYDVCVCSCSGGCNMLMTVQGAVMYL